MKTMIKTLAMLSAVLLSSIVMANEDISGTWQGNLEIGPDTKLAIQFIISQAPDGSYAILLNTPDEGNIKNLPANQVAYDAGNLKVDVAELSGSYDGIVKDGKIEGEWQQEGTSFPLVLKPYAKPTLSEEDMNMLLGAWMGKPVLPEGTMISGEMPEYLYQFKRSEQGEFIGTFTIKDMGVPEESVTDMGVSDGIFTFKVGMQKFTGKLTDKEIVGKLKIEGEPNFPGESLTLVKGEYKAPVYNLNLPKEIKDQLSGEWNGTLTMKSIQTISMAVVFRFETSKNGDFFGFVNMPEQGGNEIAITDADVSDGNLVLAVKAMGGKFAGKISSDRISGEWNQEMEGSNTPMTLNRGPYVAPEYALSLPEETMDQLEGKWNGNVGDLDVSFSFEKEETGNFKGISSLPMFGPNDMPIEDASLGEGKLMLKIHAPMSVEYTGELSGDKLDGELKMPMGDKIPLTLDKEMP